MRIDVIAAVPGIISAALNESIIKRARSKKILNITVYDLRDYSSGKYRQIDDKPFGGGGGMVLKPEPFFKCIGMLLEERDYDEIIFLTPQGKKFNQKMANKLSLLNNIMILCGHYKGIDQRVIDKFVTKEISIGDYVLTGGETAAIVLIDAITRLLPGALGNSESALSDSFQTDSIFDAPQYTRPADFMGMKVPEILLSGDHNKINEWKKTKGIEKFRKVRKKKINRK